MPRTTPHITSIYKELADIAVRLTEISHALRSEVQSEYRIVNAKDYRQAHHLSAKTDEEVKQFCIHNKLRGEWHVYWAGTHGWTYHGEDD